MNSKAIQSANVHAATTHAQAKADAVEGKTEQPRPTLTFDGWGINGPDDYRPRLATFENWEHGKNWGPLLAAAPELRDALAGMLEWARRVKGSNPGPEIGAALKAIAKAKGSL